MNNKTKKLTALGMLCDLAYVAAAVGRIPIVLFWITPFYMGCTREAVAELLLPAFLPFNLIKGGLNASITMLLYRPVLSALRRSHFL